MRLVLVLIALLACVAPASAQTEEAEGPDGARLAAPGAPDPEAVDPGRFSTRPADFAYGAYQRGYYLTALNLATPLALGGDAAAQTLIGEIYSRGLGVRRDLARATEWYEQAAERNVPEALFQLAMIRLDGGEEFGDPDSAHELMRRAADSGHRLAQFNYAQMLLGPRATAEEEAQAISYYERAAKAGLPDAQYAMSQVYGVGAGSREPDAQAARRWLEAAAGQGFVTAQIELGSQLVESGVENQEKEGFSWLMRAASAGNPAAQNRIAKLYRSGIGVEPDRVAAAMWYLRARRVGLVDPVMEDQLQGLTEEELSLATLNSDRLN